MYSEHTEQTLRRTVCVYFLSARSCVSPPRVQCVRRQRVLLTTIEVLSGLRVMDRVINRRRRRFSCRIAVVVVASLALVPPGAVVVALTLVAFLVPVFF